jgi:hypothetical protein
LIGYTPFEFALRDGHRPTDKEVVPVVENETTQEIAAAKAGMDVKTARKYLRTQIMDYTGLQLMPLKI